MRISVKGGAVENVEFELEQDDDDVNVLANGDMIGWFEVNSDGKIEFVPSYPNDKNSFATTEDGALVTHVA